MAVFRVADMTCGGCAGRIQRALTAMDETARIEINLRERMVQVSGAATDSEFVEAIQEAGYTPVAIDPVSGSTVDAAKGECRGSVSPGASCCG